MLNIGWSLACVLITLIVVGGYVAVVALRKDDIEEEL